MADLSKINCPSPADITCSEFQLTKTASLDNNLIDSVMNESKNPLQEIVLEGQNIGSGAMVTTLNLNKILNVPSPKCGCRHRCPAAPP